VTIKDKLFKTLAYTLDIVDGRAILNQTIEFKEGELYFVYLDKTEGCIQTSPSGRIITPSGTWFVQDMWCSDKEYCPMSVKMYNPYCEELTKNKVVGENGGESIITSLNNTYTLLTIMTLILVIVIIFIYFHGKKQGRGEALELFIDIRNIEGEKKK